MTRRQEVRSQVTELFLHVAEVLGCGSDREVAQIADVSVDNVANWRSGSVREFKTQTFNAIKNGLAARIHGLLQQKQAVQSTVELDLVPLEVEYASNPSAMQRQFVDRMIYDYLGHRFLYFEPQGALAWENLIREGYEQNVWLLGVKKCLHSWLEQKSDGQGMPGGALARRLGFARRGGPSGLDVVSLGPGEGSKEVIVLRELLVATQARLADRLPWLTLALVDVSIPLLLTAARSAHREIIDAGSAAGSASVLPFCADFEEGDLDFVDRLPTASLKNDGLRLILLLGNVFGNLRDEERFLQQKLSKLVRGGDMVWLEVGLRLANIEEDPVYAMTLPDQEPTAAYTNRVRLLEGPYRRWEAAIGRPASELETRIWVRENDETCPVPGSLNFCHDLLIKTERRICTMLYSRRYELEALCAWWERHGFAIERIAPICDSRGVQRAVNLLVQRR